MLAEVSGWFTFTWIDKFRSLHMHFRCLRKFPADLHSHESANSGVYTYISDACGSFRLIYIPMNWQIPEFTHAFPMLAEVSGWFTFPWIGKFRSLHMHFRCLRKFLADLHSMSQQILDLAKAFRILAEVSGWFAFPWIGNTGVYTCISDACGSFWLIYIPMNWQIPEFTHAFPMLAEVSGWFTFPWIGKFRSLHMHSDACGIFWLIYIPMSQQIPDLTNEFWILAEVSGWFTFPRIGKFRPCARTSAFLVCSDASGLRLSFH
jgi:hypothetical protein